MAKAKKNALREQIEGLRSEYNIGNCNAGGFDNVVDVITFCNDPRFLNIPKSFPTGLWRSQQVVLKVLYMGTPGNENLHLSEDDWNWLNNENMYYKDGEVTLKKIKEKIRNPKIRFQEMQLVLGRRSSKTLVASIIACYEIYKLLEVEQGDPHKYYGLPTGQEIAVLCVSTAAKQTKRVYNMIKTRLQNAPYFSNRVAKDSMEETRFYTNDDLKQKEKKGTAIKNEGSLVIVCGHSDPDSLRGYEAVCIIFDELGFYDESAKVSGSDFYLAMQPSIAKLANKQAGLLIEISSPGPKGNIFHQLWEESMKMDRLESIAFRLPTWVFDDNTTEENSVLASAKKRNPDGYAVEYGAEWPESGAFNKFFEPEIITNSIKSNIYPMLQGVAGEQYYIHVDPALKHDLYALVVLKRMLVASPDGAMLPSLKLVSTRVWKPIGRNNLNFTKIDKEVLELCRLFKPMALTYDDFNTVHSVEYFRRSGINCYRTPFNPSYKQNIYTNLYELMTTGRMHLYDPSVDDNVAIMVEELKNLSYRPTKRGVSIGPDPRAEIDTDDFSDCLAGAAFVACGGVKQSLPSAVLANTGGMGGMSYPGMTGVGTAGSSGFLPMYGGMSRGRWEK